MAATSEEFKAALKEGRIVDALKTALGQSIELEITTTIASSDPQIGSATTPKETSQEVMRTKLNIVEGKISTEIGSKFLEGGKFAELRDFHVSQMQASGQIIERNISSLQKLLEMWVGMTQQAVSAQDGKTHSPELKILQPDAIASDSSDRLAALGTLNLAKGPEELTPVESISQPVTTEVTGGIPREPEVTSSENDDAEVLAALELDNPSTDDLAFTRDPETAEPSAEKGEKANSALKTAAVVAGTAAVVGTAAAAAAAAWGSREDETAPESDLTDSEALADLDLDEATMPEMHDELETSSDLGSTWDETDTDEMHDELETSPDLGSTWDETELVETPLAEEPVLSEETAIDSDPDTFLDSIPESEEPVTEDLMMGGTELDLAPSWDETELLEDQPEPEAMAPDLLAETSVESEIEDEPVKEEEEVEIMGAFETEESGSAPAKEDETAEILGVLETEHELEPSWEEPELLSDSQTDSLALGIDDEVSASLALGIDDEVSADLMGTASEELAPSWEEPETSWEADSKDEWPTALEDEDPASEAGQLGGWESDEDLDPLWQEGETGEETTAVQNDETDEYALPMDGDDDEALADVFGSSDMEVAEDLEASESTSDGELDSMWDSSETPETQAWENQALAEDPFGSSEAGPLWEESETDPLAGALEESSESAAGDDDAFGMNGMDLPNQELESLWGEETESQELELSDSQSDAFAEADDADPFFDSGMSSDEGLLELADPTDEDAALMSAFDSDGDADMGFDEPQPYPGTTGADLGLDGEVLDDVFSSSDMDMSAAEFATEESQAAEEASGSMFDTDEMALDEFDVDMFGESEPQGNGTKKATATAGDNGSYDRESDDPLAALLADTNDNDVPAQAGDFESEEEFDPLAELFAESDQESDINSGSAETDDLDSLFSDDLNAGDLDDPFADLELAESPSGSQKSKKKR